MKRRNLILLRLINKTDAAIACPAPILYVKWGNDDKIPNNCVKLSLSAVTGKVLAISDWDGACMPAHPAVRHLKDLAKITDQEFNAYTVAQREQLVIHYTTNIPTNILDYLCEEKFAVQTTNSFGWH